MGNNSGESYRRKRDARRVIVRVSLLNSVIWESSDDSAQPDSVRLSVMNSKH